LIKYEYKGLGLDAFYEKIENGLEIFVVPMPKFTSTFATFTSKYGSCHNNFKLEEDKEFTIVPHGIAHFLEHKMFEMKDKEDPFAFYAKTGSYCNANTWNYRTVYLFESLNNFNENLNYLLDYVQDIYLTEDNVQKEKGIITEEAKMYYDYPSERLDMMSSDIFFHNDYMKYPVIGTFESINNITKEDLEKCYKTFYHPSNMFLTIAGPVVPSEIIELVKKNQNSKNFLPQSKIIFKENKEPDHVLLEYKEDTMDIEVPRVEINYKIKFEDYSVEKRLLGRYFSLYLSMLIGQTSDFGYDMVTSLKILNDFEYGSIIAKDHLLLKIYFSSNDYQEVIDKVKNEVKTKNIDKEAFEIKKNRTLANYISKSESVSNIVYDIIETYTSLNVLPFDSLEVTKNLSFETLKEIIDKTTFDNVSVAVLKPKSFN
jgi:predicted Zn-dependent peptidase